MEYLTNILYIGRPCSKTRHIVLKQYKKLGETKAAIVKIQKEVNRLVKNKYKIASVLPNYIQLLKEVETTREHKIIRLADDKYFKAAIHIIPSHFEIPAHLHIGQISAVNIQQGALQIGQSTLNDNEKNYQCTLQEQQTCVGLPRLRNMHHIQTTTDACIFISFRLSKKKPLSMVNKLRTIIASMAIMVLPDILHAFPVAAVKNQIIASYQFAANTYEQSNSNVRKANKLRTSEGAKENLYIAAQIYKQEAKKGNAEAQYWLGIMYLEGLGITDDSDEALHWIALSSDQEYPPAKKALHKILTTEYVSDC